ncbi:hypothetical protein [Winogradskyella sp. 3972H.M.0a.05]|uniref:hypothetical protein n=1 Tax=Winogradskyella sp. 3972H.M.0a.05 TaxID=2950277 RepID=UPI00339778AC
MFRDMRIKFLVILLSAIAVVSCKKEANTSEADQVKEEQSQKRDQITRKDIEDLSYSDYVLSSEADKLIMDWQKFQEFNSQIDFLKQAEFSFFRNDKKIMTTLLDEMKSTIPEQINTNTIQSRIIVVETTALKLYDVLNLNNVEKNIKLTAIKEILASVSYLNLQINKKLELDANNIKRPSNSD